MNHVTRWTKDTHSSEEDFLIENYDAAVMGFLGTWPRSLGAPTLRTSQDQSRKRTTHPKPAVVLLEASPQEPKSPEEREL